MLSLRKMFDNGKKKVIIAGNRTYTNFDFLEKEVLKFLEEEKLEKDKIEIISGGAKGADLLGEKFADKYEIPTHVMLANWNSYGKSAGPKRNEEMAKLGDYLIAFWNGESKGTKNMINNAKKYGLKIKIIKI